MYMVFISVRTMVGYIYVDFDKIITWSFVDDGVKNLPRKQHSFAAIGQNIVQYPVQSKVNSQLNWVRRNSLVNSWQDLAI